MSAQGTDIFTTTLIVAPALLVAVILHEVAHGLVAERLGDATARSLGRITLNPLKHIDLFMTILLPATLILAGSPIVFGGAKPVPVNPRFFKNPRGGMGWVAIAGPITNACLAFLSYLLYLPVAHYAPQDSLVGQYVLAVLTMSVLVNVVLAAFNLLPVPPLDGGRIAVALLPKPIALRWAQLERFGLFIVAGLLLSGIVEKVLSPIIELTLKLF
jgi:Zn-dependent protease